MRLVAGPLLFALASLAASGCVPPPPPGDVAFFWTFAGEESCARARVLEVDVAIVDANDLLKLSETVLCEGDGLLYEDFVEGDYTIFLDAYDRRGNLLYQGEQAFHITSGELTDLGDINLVRAGEAALGDLAFYWTFDGETDCARAGVAEVDVEVIDAVSEASLLQETVVCDTDGLFLLDIRPGAVDVLLDAFDAQNRRLYEATVPANVIAGQVADLGEIDLSPVP